MDEETEMSGRNIKCDECNVSYSEDLIVLKRNLPRYPNNVCTFCYNQKIGLW